MAIYIRGSGTISPQQTWDEEPFLAQPKDYKGDRLTCIEPDYSKYISPQHLRRMSRIIKMGVAAGSMALQQAGVTVPDGIITGTGFGCLEDTGTFLEKMWTNKELALNPTPFIQSTHNTIGSQIALLLQCQGYNQTYTQEAMSFESCLLDAMLTLHDHPDQSILAGGIDEITKASHNIQSRFGIFRKNSVSSLDLLTASGKGTLQGEGAGYFVLSGKKMPIDKVSLASVATFFSPRPDELMAGINQFLSVAGLKNKDLDLILLGKSGDNKGDQIVQTVSGTLFSSSSIGFFKHLCGEYPTATAFALELGTRILRSGKVPHTIAKDIHHPVKNILIFNSYFNLYHSLILLSAC